MVQLGFRKPTNAWSQNCLLDVEYFKVGTNATAAKMLPGTVVCKDTNDFSVKESDASANDYGVLGYDKTPAAYRPTNSTTAYAVGDIVAVSRGPGRKKCRLTTSQTIVNGQPLKVTTDGLLTAATVGTNDVFADADESVTTTSAEAFIWVITRK